MGRLKQIILVVVAVCIVGYAAMQVLNAGDASPTSANSRILKDAESGELVEIEVRPGMGPYPHENPKTGKKTLYPTEICFANDCDRKGGTRVILNAWLGVDKPTLCPNCGALVTVMNRSKKRTAQPGE